MTEVQALRTRLQKDPSAELDYTADFRRHCTRYRDPDTDYALNTRVQPRSPTGLQYNASTGGRTGAREPRWPTTVGGTVTDGSVVWTAEAISSGSLKRTLSTATWSATTGVTVGTPTNTSIDSTVLIAGGVDGQTYEVVCVGTFSDGTDQVVVFDLAVERLRSVSC